MVVILLSSCPTGLKGDLTKWMYELSATTYVGNMPERTRVKLWDRVKDLLKDGQALMVYSQYNEQGLKFESIGWKRDVVDFDGLLLLRKPDTPKQTKEKESSEVQLQTNSEKQTVEPKPEPKILIPSTYVVLDTETTGLYPANDLILEVGAVKVENNVIVDHYSSLIAIDMRIPKKITELTGITDADVRLHGKNEKEVLEYLLNFIGDLPIIGHNVRFDLSFLEKGCKRQELEMIDNQVFDTFEISRTYLPGLPNYKLPTLADYFKIEVPIVHRAKPDCFTTHIVVQKLKDYLETRN